MGTRLRFYEIEVGSRRITPPFTPNDPNIRVDVAPKDQWDCDVLEAHGEQRLRALVAKPECNCCFCGCRGVLLMELKMECSCETTERVRRGERRTTRGNATQGFQCINLRTAIRFTDVDKA